MKSSAASSSLNSSTPPATPILYWLHLFLIAWLMAAGTFSIVLWVSMSVMATDGSGGASTPTPTNNHPIADKLISDPRRLQCSLFSQIQEEFMPPGGTERKESTPGAPNTSICPDQNDTLPSNLSTDSTAATATIDSLKEVKAAASSSAHTPQIATFEEWTRERLLLKQAPAKTVPAPNEADHSDHQGQGQENGRQGGQGEEATAQKADSTPTSTPTSKGSSPEPMITMNGGGDMEGEGGPSISATDISTTTDATSNNMESPKRNYASKECGAKVLFANEEAENKGAVLNDRERDDYMRNPCERAQNKFLIIELCENIQITSVEIANFELFSSSPRHIRLLASERYPTLEWAPVAEFEAENSRDIQSFSIRHSQGSYAKFIRLELLSHYGHEHYCTLSSLRVYGISMVDEYEAEAAVIEAAAATMGAPSPPVGNGTMAVEAAVTSEGAPPPIIIQPQAEFNASQEAGAGAGAVVPGEVLKTVVGTLKGALESTLQSIPILSSLNMSSSTTTTDSATGPTHPWVRCRQCSLEAVARGRRRSDARCRFIHLLMNGDAGGLAVTGTRRRRTTHAKAVTPAQRAFLRQIKGRGAPKPVAGAASTAPVITPPTSPIPTPPPPPLQHRHHPQNRGPLPGTSTNHKESVFLKLNKRLSALELNISLSSEYLSELSRRYVAQSDELARQQERLLQQAKEMAERSAASALHPLHQQLQALKVEVQELRKRLAEGEVVGKPVEEHVCAPEPPPGSSLSIPQPHPSISTAEQEKVCIDGQLLENLLSSYDDGRRLEVVGAVVEEVWTTSQMAVVAVLAQLVGVLLTLAIQWLMVGLRKRSEGPAATPTNKLPQQPSFHLSVDDIRRLIRQEVAASAQSALETLRQEEEAAVMKGRKCSPNPSATALGEEVAAMKSELEDVEAAEMGTSNGHAEHFHISITPSATTASSPPWQVVSKMAKNARRPHNRKMTNGHGHGHAAVP